MYDLPFYSLWIFLLSKVIIVTTGNANDSFESNKIFRSKKDMTKCFSLLWPWRVVVSLVISHHFLQYLTGYWFHVETSQCWFARSDLQGYKWKSIHRLNVLLKQTISLGSLNGKVQPVFEVQCLFLCVNRMKSTQHGKTTEKQMIKQQKHCMYKGRGTPEKTEKSKQCQKVSPCKEKLTSKSIIHEKLDVNWNQMIIVSIIIWSFFFCIKIKKCEHCHEVTRTEPHAAL